MLCSYTTHLKTGFFFIYLRLKFISRNRYYLIYCKSSGKMDEVETKTCENCKRDIPADNFTIHSIHCARNIRMCPVCKEPFPHAELQEHHEKMHKLLPCKQCGESVCGTDLEDHIRDSCAHTMQTCKYCTLDLRRGELPAHERYCGARTEQCEQCGEWVMMRYRQLHLDSNHGFLRLDDDPPPFRKDKPNKIFNDWAKPANGIKKPDIIKDINVPRPTEIRYFQPSSSSSSSTVNEMIQRPVNENKQRQVNEMIQRTVNENKNRPLSEMNHRPMNEVKQRTVNQIKETNVEPRASSSNGAVPRPKRTNDQPQINTNVAPTNKVNKNMPMSRGAIKKRPAPKPPADPLRELPYRRALLRQQEEQRGMREKNADNLAKGLPPVLTPLEKLEKLRKMDALHNREIDDQSYKNRLNGRIWMAPDIPSGHVLGSAGSSRNTEQAQIDLEVERRKKEFKNLKPMTPEEFIERFNELQLKEPKERKNGDRFSQIKSSLRELRRDLNEVTAPYNANNASADVNQNRNCRSPEEVRLPCEFCGEAVPLDDLVQHETGCRPDLARVPPRSRSASPPPDQHGGIAQAAPRSSPPAETVIPCEFCARSLPVYLISEHQERCGRESNLLFAD